MMANGECCMHVLTLAVKSIKGICDEKSLTNPLRIAKVRDLR